METSRTTTTGRTWTGELQTTLHDSVTGAGLLPSQRAGTPRLWSSGAPLQGDLGNVMAEGSLMEMELQETPRLRPSRHHEDVRRLPGLRDPGTDHQVDRPLG